VAGFFMRGKMAAMRFRKLRIAWSVGWGALCLLLIALWVRSQAGMDELYVGFRAYQQIRIHTRPDGLRIHIDELRKPVFRAWRWRYIAPYEQRFRSPVFPWEYDEQVAGFADEYSRGHLALAIPYWFLTLTCAVAAVLLAPKTRWRFSLRTLLIATTLVAVALGVIAWLGS
jgi:hypothetical protein